MVEKKITQMAEWLATGAEVGISDKNEEIIKAFEGYDKLNGTKISSIADIRAESEKVAKEIADKALSDFPKGGEKDITSTPISADMFSAYCIRKFTETKVPEGKKNISHGPLSSLYGDGFKKVVNETWYAHAYEKLDGLAP